MKSCHFNVSFVPPPHHKDLPCVFWNLSCFLKLKKYLRKAIILKMEGRAREKLGLQGTPLSPQVWLSPNSLGLKFSLVPPAAVEALPYFSLVAKHIQRNHTLPFQMTQRFVPDPLMGHLGRQHFPQSSFIKNRPCAMRENLK